MFLSWELELETSTAPLQLHPELSRSYKFFKNRGRNWIELEKIISSALASLQRSYWFFKKFAIAPYTCTGFLIVCDFRYSASGQVVEPAWYFSPYSYWRPSFQLLGLFPQVHTKWEFVFTQFSRYLTFQEFSVPPSVYSVFNFDILAWLWVTWLFF